MSAALSAAVVVAGAVYVDFDTLQVPTKVWTEMPQAGHRPAFEQPERFAEVMRTVRDETR